MSVDGYFIAGNNLLVTLLFSFYISVGPNTISEAIARQQQQQAHSDAQQMNQPNGQNNNIVCGDMTSSNRYPSSDYQPSVVSIAL